MARYGYNQCDECGGVRVARSKLCANCLVKAYERVNLQIARADLRIIGVEKEVARYHEQMAAVLQYGFEKNQENAKLQRHIREIQKEMERGMEDEKDRERDDMGE